MTWKRTALEFSGRWLPDMYRPPAGVLFPFGHIVGEVAPPHVSNLFQVPNVAKLKANIEFLCRNYEPMRLSELEKIPRLRNGKTSARRFVLSFDDGMREVYEVIAPILRDKGIPAIFFLNSATIDNRRLMWRHKVSLLIERSKQQPERVPAQLGARPGESLQAKLSALRFADEGLIDELAKFYELDFDDYLNTARPYLTSDQVLELWRAGFEIGSHSDTHPYFCELTADQQKQQISTSVSFIRQLGLPCRCFAFPFHDSGVPVSVFDHMKSLGIALSLGTSEARIDSIVFSFQRFAIDAENSNASLPEVLQQLSAKSLVRRLTRSETIQRN
jgi:peptidoglycan/xylan/chitin deacetylase (PgdA/CDA1 family)